MDGGSHGVAEFEAARGFITPSPMLQSLLLIAATVGVLVVSCLFWPGQRLQQELMWVVAPREAERSRIRRLILPTEVCRALDPSAACTHATDCRRHHARLDLGRG